MKRILFLLLVLASVQSAQSAEEKTFRSKQGIELEVPAGFRAVERTIFTDSGAYDLGSVTVIKILPQGVREEAAMGREVRLEIFSSTLPGRKASAPESTGEHEVYRVHEGKGMLISSRDPVLLDSVLSSLRFVAADPTREEEGTTEESAAPANPPRVRMVYLVPSDRSPNPKYRNQMERAIRELQGFYKSQLGGKTFTLNHPVVEVVRTSHPVSWYTTTAPASSNEGRFWESVTADGFALLHGSFNDPENRWVFYIDADPLCNQYVGGTSGVALLPANDLRGLGCELNRPVCSGSPLDSGALCRWVGGLGHELGHAFLLPHPELGTCPDRDRNCDHALMWLGYTTFPNAYLLPLDKSSLLTSPATKDFFRPLNVRQVRSCTRGCTRALDE